MQMLDQEMFKNYATLGHVTDCYTSYYYDSFMQGTGPFQYHHFSHPLHIIVTPSPDGSLLTNKVKVAVSPNNQAMMIRVSVFFTCAAD
jgi:hypothetical protein